MSCAFCLQEMGKCPVKYKLYCASPQKETQFAFRLCKKFNLCVKRGLDLHKHRIIQAEV